MALGGAGEKLYEISDGKFGYRGGGGGESKLAEAGRAVGAYCVKQGDDENNAVYDTRRRVEKITAVTSLVSADYLAHRQVQQYRNIVNGTDSQAYLSSLGYGNSAQTTANNMLSNGFEGTVMGGHSPVPTHFINNATAAGNLTNAEKTELMTTGQFTRNVSNGAGGVDKVVFKVKGVDSGQVQKALVAAQNEQSRNRRITGAHNTKDQIKMFRELRSDSLSKLKDAGISVGNGTAHELARERANLERQVRDLRRSGQNAAASTAQNKLDKLNEHEQKFGAKDARAEGRWASNQRMGKRIVARGVMGDDFFQGYDTMTRTVQVSTFAVRTAVRAADTLAYNSGKFLANHVPSSPLQKQLQNINDRHKEHRDTAKRRDQARKSGEMKDFRKEQKQKRAERRTDRSARRDKRFESRQTELRNRGENARADRRQLRRDRGKERKGKVTGSGNNVKTGFGNVKDAFGKIGDFLKNNRLARIIRAPFNFVGTVKAVVMKAIWKVLLVPAGIILLVLLLIAALITIVSYALYFLSEIVQPTDFQGALDNINYVQHITDGVTNEMGLGFLEVAKKDAETNYLTTVDAGWFTAGAVPSDGLSWYKAPGDAEIGSIVASETGAQLSGVNANVLPIISAMHYRYYEDLTFLEYTTAKAYAYYMYVNTHHLDNYSYDNAPNCPQSDLFESGSRSYSWDEDDESLTRGTDEKCTNLYYHGYNSSMNETMNDIRSSLLNGLNTALSALGMEAFDSSAYGVFDSIPSDTINEITYNCSHYDRVRGALSCEMIEHAHGTDCNADACDHADCDDCEGGDLDCDLNHTHTGSCYEDEYCGHSNHSSDCCSLTPHDHDENLDSDTCCYNVKYICEGHCGGHITPLVNVKVDMDYKTFAEYDNFKTPHLLGTEDFKTDWVTEMIGLKSIAQWKTYWNAKAATWYLPFPTSPSGFVENWAKHYVYYNAALIDGITEEVASWFGFEEAAAENDAKELAATDAQSDYFGFAGWYNEDGTLNESLIADMESLYGTPDNNYADGIDAWKNFDVYFSAGFNRQLSDTQKDLILEQLKSRYNFTREGREKRYDSVIAAMDSSGQFWYDLSTRTQNADATEGRIDCSGFISGVLRRGAHWNGDWTAASFASAGTMYGGSPTSLLPGDIIAKNTSSSWSAGSGWSNGESNHVVMFIGWLENGVEGYPEAKDPGYYIIDCSSSQDGSMLRKVEEDFFDDYPYVYRNCYN